jgi:hypothetical protein
VKLIDFSPAAVVTRPQIWLLATVAALSLALLGCGNSADHAAPDDGTYWTVPADHAADADYWFDDSSKVSRTEPHTTETVSVEGQGVLAEQAADRRTLCPSMSISRATPRRSAHG